ncbi:PPR_2 domain-containing protein [Cephalotus follicularis]|uniref:PPR_2 domain-containing protein n=1 Tax=Cephalotus follicularis TaxID=3775 RepID=A0A1Q3C080_CEPFO|nr:PPR_2 domain-containing protein [Cephalotus follicularis]
MMRSLKFNFPQMINPQNVHKNPLLFPVKTPNIVTCGLRGGPRKPLWRTSVLSTEAIQAVHSLKLAKSNTTKLAQIFNTRLTRLLKADLLDALGELQRQNEFELALKVFTFVRKEVCYAPDIFLYCDIIQMVGKNKLIGMAEEFFCDLEKEGLKPNTRAFAEMIGAYLHVGMIEKAMETYGTMKAAGCTPDRLTLTILIRNLDKAGEDELAATVKKECLEYVDSPEKFLEEIEQKHAKTQSQIVV